MVSISSPMHQKVKLLFCVLNLSFIWFLSFEILPFYSQLMNFVSIQSLCFKIYILLTLIFHQIGSLNSQCQSMLMEKKCSLAPAHACPPKLSIEPTHRGPRDGYQMKYAQHQNVSIDPLKCCHHHPSLVYKDQHVSHQEKHP